MYRYMHGDGWSWFWMIPMMLVWIAVLAGAVCLAVRFAMQHSQRSPLNQ